MTRSSDQQPRTVDGQVPSVPFGGAVTHAADVRAVRERLAGMILPGGTDTGGPGSRQVLAEWVDLLGELEAVKNTVTATQAR
ncbi:hypothetical protein, partial [Promicromonospora soli]|uniref:hypothetical protein n=1 Tax=Promicromonospora soli TaxID=2035533 RepID=UPI001672265B